MNRLRAHTISPGGADFGSRGSKRQATAAMTSTDTIELIISDLNKQRDARGVVDTNSVLSILARINVLLWREYGDEPLSADNLPQLDNCA